MRKAFYLILEIRYYEAKIEESEKEHLEDWLSGTTLVAQA